MALQEVFAAPLGLAALLLAIPIVVLYLIRPDPRRLELPTFRFLADVQRQRATTPLLERLSRSLLLLLQLLAVALIAIALASPYVLVAERTTVQETVLVVDTSASMSATDGGTSRFAAAVDAAGDAVTTETSVVTTANRGEVLAQRARPSEARATLQGLEATDAPGDLRGAIEQAAVLAGEDARIVVLSDFAGTGWTDAVTAARARGIAVELRQFDRGGTGNVGFVDRQFSGTEVALTVRNLGETPATRTVRLGDRRRELRLGPGDSATLTLPVPTGGGRATLQPTDDFPTDDTVYVAAPTEDAIDVLVLTNDRNRFLTAALSVIDQVNLTVARPPTTIDPGYDVIVYSNVDPASLLPGNVQRGRDLLADGGGVAIQAQPDMPAYGELLLLESTGLETHPRVESTTEHAITRDIEFQPPTAYHAGSLRSGRALVRLDDGSPLLATATRGPGRLLYYGYIEERSGFKYNYQYPVFWKRAVFHLAGRPTLPSLNHETGETATFDADTVTGPEDPIAGPTVPLRDAGFYATGDGRQSASLLDAAESDTDVEPLAERSDATADLASTEPRRVPRSLAEFPAVAALAIALLEVAFLHRRGDL